MPASPGRVALCLLLALAIPVAAQDEGGGEDDGEAWLDQPGMIPPVNDPSVPKQRQWTALQLLRWEWDVAYIRRQEGEKPLAEEAALVALADRDERPLFIVRECKGCKQASHEMVQAEKQGEKTMLLGRWFHAVRVSDDVLEETHPFHALFDAKLPPHVVAATADGKESAPLAARATQAQLWKLMSGVLRKAYRKDPEAAVKRLLALLDEWDLRDAQLVDLTDRLAALRQAEKPDEREIARVEARKKEVEAERWALLEEGKALDDLGLKLPEPALPGG
ncbi:MAG: hypothetical protein FJ296_03560 [Planctomycetes bacterium]|nr:hypothetical protein [Planctomycetota bacterium]